MCARFQVPTLRFDDRRDQHVLVCSHDHALFALSAHLRCCAAAQPVRDLHLIRARMRAETTPRLSKIAFGRLHGPSVLVEPTLACCCVHAQQDCSTPATATQMHSPTELAASAHSVHWQTLSSLTRRVPLAPSRMTWPRWRQHPCATHDAPGTHTSGYRRRSKCNNVILV